MEDKQERARRAMARLERLSPSERQKFEQLIKAIWEHGAGNIDPLYRTIDTIEPELAQDFTEILQELRGNKST